MFLEEVIKTELGNFLCEAEDEKLTKFYPTERELTDSKLLSRFSSIVQTQVSEYLNGERKKFDIPIKLSGTQFRQDVWNTVFREVEYGEVVTYSDVAEMCGHPGACRAVGSALHVIPIIIIIPCHRVVAKSHGGNYKYGLNMKNKLLELERKNS